MINTTAKLKDISVRRVNDELKELTLSFDNDRHHSLTLDTKDDAIMIIGSLQNFINVIRADVVGGRL